MKLYTILLAMVVLPLTLPACSTMKQIQYANIGIEFEKSLRDYMHLVRWHELDSAASSFVSPQVLEDYRKKIPAASDVKVTDYRLTKMECDPAKGEATATVEIDYYHPPGVTVHTTKDYQKWSYEGPEARRAWRLRSLLPDFK